MGSFDRSKKRIQLWKKALIHFSLCFVMGFFTGFAPTSTASFFSSQLVAYQPIKNLGIQTQPIEALQKPEAVQSLNRSLLSNDEISFQKQSSTAENATWSTFEEFEEEEEDEQVEVGDNNNSNEEKPKELLIVITTTKSSNKQTRLAMLQRLSNTLSLVPSPLVWIVVEPHEDAPRTAKFLRKTGIMYRHLTYKENFTDPSAEADYQGNVALNHIEHHRLTGIVHFAMLSNVYDLRFFEEIRDIEGFGVWPVAMLSANRKRVIVEGPICRSSQVVGWRQKDFSSGATVHMRTSATSNSEIVTSSGEKIDIMRTLQGINISGFAFNSSILWDPERWGRPSSDPDISQDSIKFVRQVVLEDESKLKGIPADCSVVMLWHLHVPRNLSLLQNQDKNR